MELTVLAMMMIVQMFLLVMSYKYKGILLFLFSALAGMATIVTIVGSNAEIEYVSNGAVVTISSGSFFLLVPTLLTILAFVGMISLRGRR